MVERSGNGTGCSVPIELSYRYSMTETQRMELRICKAPRATESLCERHPTRLISSSRPMASSLSGLMLGEVSAHSQRLNTTNKGSPKVAQGRTEDPFSGVGITAGDPLTFQEASFPLAHG